MSQDDSQSLLARVTRDGIVETAVKKSVDFIVRLGERPDMMKQGSGFQNPPKALKDYTITEEAVIDGFLTRQLRCFGMCNLLHAFQFEHPKDYSRRAIFKKGAGCPYSKRFFKEPFGPTLGQSRV